MEKEIHFISPYPEMTQLAQRLVREGYKQIDVTTATLAKGAETARKLEKGDTRIIISRGATGALIKESVHIPVILVQISCYDIILALHKAKKIGKKIALFIYVSHKNDHNFNEIKKIMGFRDELSIYFYRSSEELYRQMYHAHEAECEVAVSAGNCILEKAKMLGIEGVMIGSSEEAIRHAFTRGAELLEVMKKDEEIKSQLNAILNHIHGGVLAVDAKGTVTYYNDAASKALQIPKDAVIGRNIEELAKNINFKKLYAGGEPFVGGIIELDNCNYIINRLPLKIESGDLGMMITFQKTQNIEKIEAEIRKKLHAKGFVATHDFSDIVTRSDKMTRLINRAKNYGQTDGTVLITGESGTGKELFAQSIHKGSARKNEAFVAINCATLPPHLLESELFGYCDGAFTGAKKGGQPGLFEIAHKGTVFLDEILEMPLSLQARLLRVLQERNVRRVGGDKLIPVDVRIIASANKSLSEAVKENNFRMDLFFRLNELSLHIPPLKTRKNDLPFLVAHFIEKHHQYMEKQPRGNNETGTKRTPGNQLRAIMNENNINRLRNYEWLGNVRELENFVKRYLLLAHNEEPELVLDELLSEYHFPAQIPDSTNGGLANESENSPLSLDYEKGFIPVRIGTLKEMEENIILEFYQNRKYKKEELADLLGISRTTLWKKLKASPERFQ